MPEFNAKPSGLSRKVFSRRRRKKHLSTAKFEDTMQRNIYGDVVRDERRTAPSLHSEQTDRK
jgi:hypothetical protein